MPAESRLGQCGTFGKRKTLNCKAMIGPKSVIFHLPNVTRLPMHLSAAYAFPIRREARAGPRDLRLSRQYTVRATMLLPKPVAKRHDCEPGNEHDCQHDERKQGVFHGGFPREYRHKRAKILPKASGGEIESYPGAHRRVGGPGQTKRISFVRSPL